MVLTLEKYLEISLTWLGNRTTLQPAVISPNKIMCSLPEKTFYLGAYA